MATGQHVVSELEIVAEVENLITMEPEFLVRLAVLDAQTKTVVRETFRILQLEWFY